MPAIARIGDQVTHDHLHFGDITTGATRTTACGALVARVGDMATCPEHGPREIAEGSATVIAEGAGVARVGDKLACGAVITSGAPSVGVGG